MAKTTLNTKEAADLLGVGTSTIKRWADEGLLAHSKTVGGHRRFLRIDVLRLSGEPSMAKPVQPSMGIRGMPTAEEWVAFIQTHDDLYAIAARMLDACVRLESWCRVASELGEVLERVGRMWEEGSLSVVDEHVITERMLRALAWCGRTIPLPSNAPVCLLLCAEGDEHTAGLALVELCARSAGWSVVWTGRATPLSSLEEWLQVHSIRLVAVSASAASNDAEELLRQSERLEELTRSRGISLVLGGAGAWPEHPSYGRRLHTLEALHQLLDKEG